MSEAESYEEEEVYGLNLERLSLQVSELRSEAIRRRQESGIEEQWREDEEFYLGIDDANRGEFKSSWLTKPMGEPGVKDPGKVTGSTIFFNITRPYVDAAAAKTAEILLPAEDRGWEIKPTPIPELTSIAKGEIPVRIEGQIQQEFDAKVEARMMTRQEADEAAQQTRVDLMAEIQEDMKEALRRAEKAQRQIEDWHAETNYNAENRVVIEDGARIGTGILRGPLPEMRRSVAYKNGALIIKDEEVPASRRASPWNCYPDMGCGNDIQDGSYFFEKDYISENELAELMRDPSYLPDQIMKVLREGAKLASPVYEADENGIGPMAGLKDPDGAKRHMYEIWYCYMHLTREDFEAAGQEPPEGEYISVPAEVTIVNNCIIKMIMSPFESGEYPYDFFVWQRQQDSPFGIGVSRQIRNAQRMVNAAARNMMDNAGIAGGPMWAYKPGLITPLDEKLEIRPRKGWIVDEDADLDDIREAFAFFEVPMHQEQLERIIQLGLKLAEDVTGLPMLLQGQQGAAPETVGGMQLLNNNASTVMRRIARNHDDLLTVRHINRYYQYLLVHSDDDEMKGDFEINAVGANSLVERDIQEQYLAQIGDLVMQPIFGVDPKKWFNDQMRRKGINPEKLAYDDDEWQQIVQNMAQPQPDSTIESAKIRAEALVQVEQVRAEVAAMKEQNKATQAGEDRQLKWMLGQLEAEIDAMEIEGLNQQTIEKVKGSLAQTVMRLKTQERISMATQQGKEVAQTPTEPAGRAEEGRAFEQ